MKKPWGQQPIIPPTQQKPTFTITISAFANGQVQLQCNPMLPATQVLACLSDLVAKTAMQLYESQIGIIKSQEQSQKENVGELNPKSDGLDKEENLDPKTMYDPRNAS